MNPEHTLSFEYKVLHVLRRIIRSADIYSRKLNTEFGLTTPQLLCLQVLVQSGKITLSDLAKAVSLGGSTVNGIADRLEAKKFAIRKQSTNDRRKVYLEITPLGKKTFTKAPSLLQDKLAVALALLPEKEQFVIIKSLECIADLTEVDDIGPAPNITINKLDDSNNEMFN